MDTKSSDCKQKDYLIIRTEKHNTVVVRLLILTSVELLLQSLLRLKNYQFYENSLPYILIFNCMVLIIMSLLHNRIAPNKKQWGVLYYFSMSFMTVLTLILNFETNANTIFDEGPDETSKLEIIWFSCFWILLTKVLLKLWRSSIFIKLLLLGSLALYLIIRSTFLGRYCFQIILVPVAFFAVDIALEARKSGKYLNFREKNNKSMHESVKPNNRGSLCFGVSLKKLNVSTPKLEAYLVEEGSHDKPFPQEEFINELFLNLSDALIVYNQADQEIYCNNSMAELLGPPQDVMNKFFTKLYVKILARSNSQQNKPLIRRDWKTFKTAMSQFSSSTYLHGEAGRRLSSSYELNSRQESLGMYLKRCKNIYFSKINTKMGPPFMKSQATLENNFLIANDELSKNNIQENSFAFLAARNKIEEEEEGQIKFEKKLSSKNLFAALNENSNISATHKSLRVIAYESIIVEFKEDINLSGISGEEFIFHTAITFFDVPSKKNGDEEFLYSVSMRRMAANELNLNSKEFETFKIKILSTISHELRTPLNCSINLLEILEDKIKGDLANMRLLQPSLYNCKLLLSNIDDILDYSCILSSHFIIHPSKFSLRQLLIETANLISFSADERSNQIRSEYKADLPDWIVSDVNRVRQVFINLLQNANKYTNGGRIIITAKRYRDKDIKICVRDTGSGIKNSILKKIGILNAAKEGKLIGMGLTISNYIASQLSPREREGIFVRSKEGKGSVFSFYLENMDESRIYKGMDSFSINRMESDFEGYTKRSKKTPTQNKMHSRIHSYQLAQNVEDGNGEVLIIQEIPEQQEAENYYPKEEDDFSIENKMDSLKNEGVSYKFLDSVDKPDYSDIEYEYESLHLPVSEEQVKPFANDINFSQILKVPFPLEKLLTRNNNNDSRDNASPDDDLTFSEPSEKVEELLNYNEHNERKAHLDGRLTVVLEEPGLSLTLQRLESSSEKNIIKSTNTSGSSRITALAFNKTDKVIDNFDINRAQSQLCSGHFSFEKEEHKLVSSNKDYKEETKDKLQSSSRNSFSGSPKADIQISKFESSQLLPDLHFSDVKEKLKLLKTCTCPDILVVDDNGYNLMVLRVLIEGLGLKVDTANSGDEAVSLVRKYLSNTNEACSCKFYKVIFMDIDMPEKDGIQTTKEINAVLKENLSKKEKFSTILACTAFNENEFGDKCKEAGMKGFVTKPVKRNILEQTLARHLRKFIL